MKTSKTGTRRCFLIRKSFHSCCSSQIGTFEASVWASSGGDSKGKRGSALYQNLHALDGACQEDSRASRAASEGERTERSNTYSSTRSPEGRNLFADTIRFASNPFTRRGLSVRAWSYQCKVHTPHSASAWHSHFEYDASAEAGKLNFQAFDPHWMFNGLSFSRNNFTASTATIISHCSSRACTACWNVTQRS